MKINEEIANQNINGKPEIVTEETSKRITSLRFLLAVSVIFIHNNLTADTALNYYHLDFLEPQIITWLKILICNFISTAAVPLFFVFAGYLQCRKNDSYGVLLRKRAKSLLMPFVLWTFLAVLMYFIGQSIPALSFFMNNDNNIVREWGLKDWLNLFWVHWSDTVDGNTFVTQFWFLRNLIILVILSPVLRFLRRKIPFAFIAIVFVYYIHGSRYGITKSLFFYVTGIYLAEYDIDFFSISDKIKWYEFLCIFILEMICQILIPSKIRIIEIGAIIACLFFLKLSKSIISNKRLFGIAEYLSGFTFFLFAIHNPFIEPVLNKLSYRIIPLHGIGCLFQFIIPTILTVIIGTTIGIICKKLFPPVFTILNGGRN